MDAAVGEGRSPFARRRSCRGYFRSILLHLMSVVWLVTLRRPSPLWRKVPRLAGGGSTGRGGPGRTGCRRGPRTATTSRTAARRAAEGTPHRGRAVLGRSAAGPRRRRTHWRLAGPDRPRSAAAPYEDRAPRPRPRPACAPPATVPARKVRPAPARTPGSRSRTPWPGPEPL